MMENLRIFKLLMYKNAVVRKKHWKLILFVEVSIPVVLFLLGQTVRMLAGGEPERIDRNSTYKPDGTDPLPHSDFQLRYAPNNHLTDEIMEMTRNCMTLLPEQMISSKNEDALVADVAREQATNPYMAILGVVFENFEDGTLRKHFKYKVRTTSKLPQDLYYTDQENSNAAALTFTYIPLIAMQKCLDNAYIKKVSPMSSTVNITMTTQRMPYPPYVYVSAQTKLAGDAFAELARLAFLVVLCVEVTFPTNEKYIGINILMSVNGVKNIQNLFSWLISGVMFSVVYLAPIVIMLKYFLPPSLVPYLIYGNSFVVWLVLTIHACHVIAFGMHVTAYLWKPSHGVFVTLMVTLLMDIVNKFVTGAKISRFLIYLGIISPNFLLKRIFDEINLHEAQLTGIGWDNMFTPGGSLAPVESCWGILIIFSLLGIVIHFFLAVYVYAVRPGKYGVAQSPFFFLQKTNRVFHDVDATHFDYNREDQKEFEKVPEGTLIPGIQIRELKKAYMTDWFRKTMVHALRGIDVDFYQGQITALLGHNGAGKTTMMSILSGLTSSTEGMVFIDGKNVQYELHAVQKNLGLCPQENMVFPDLNVFEQVMFFGMLKAKNKTKSQLAEEAKILLEKVNLTDKKNSLAKQLSGGQKRRMCLAMAVIGDASVLILDEPTSGMDAESKREVWDIILKLRGDKTILISTHDMEEADILGDRIAIIHSGKMRSYGTSMFLKKLYGDGQVEVTLSTEPSFDPQKVIDEIGLNAQLLNVDDGKAVLAIPFADNLPGALDTLEKQKKKLGVTGLSVSIITLEQVFLRVTKEHGGDETDSADQAAKSFIKLTGFPYFWQTVVAFFRKKFIFTRKNPWTFFISMVLPCASAILMVLDHSGTTATRRTSLTVDAYGRTRSLVYSADSLYGEKYTTSAKDFGGNAEYIGANSSMNDALLTVALKDLSLYRSKYVVSGEFNLTDDDLSANGYYSGTALLSLPATVNMLTNTIVKAFTGDDEYSISISAEELPQTFEASQRQSTDSIVLSLALVVFLAPAVALYTTQPLQENLSGVKQLQAMTGASKLAYWGCTYLFDLFQYTISIILLISLFVIADASYGTQYYHGKEIAIFFLIVFLFGVSVLPLIYIFSFWKKSLNTCINLLSITPLILGFVDFLLMGLESAVDNKIYDVFRDIQKNIFLLFPHLTIIYGHSSFFNVVLRNARCRSMPNRIIEATCSRYAHDQCCAMKCWNGSCENPAEYFVPNENFTSLPDSLIWMAGSTVLFFAIVFVLEQKLLFKIWARIHRQPLKGNVTTMDELVTKEAHLVSTEVAKMLPNKKCIQQVTSENIFLVDELSKSYGKLNVVKGISFRVKQGECFGLLGVNGAGKSTTFRMLTGEEIPHSGSMFLKNYSLGLDRTNYLAEMGYCPQQDAIIDTLNSWDHLYLFARLRGIPSGEVKAAVEKWIHKLNLKACAAQPSGTYSGGNKRRLNIAMALIGNPSLVLMDEPTTGVDPAARRSLWNTLKTCQEGGQSIILTSHSMEECEALCNRLVIMVKGQLVCVGASQELKQRFGAGYNIHVKLNPGCQSDDVYNIKRRIESTLICKLTDENRGFIGYHITDPEATWTIMYTMMNELKADYECIEDFAVLSSTLEQLFIQFARAPGDTDEPEVANGGKGWRFWKKKTGGSPV